jgi:hypothetical protein
MRKGGIEVYDGKEDITIHITKRDTTTGRKDPHNCAAAKAAKRIEGVIEAEIYRTRSYLLRRGPRGKKFYERYLTSDGLRNEAIAFDKGGTFDEGEYELWRVPKCMKLGARRGDGVIRQRTGKKPRKVHVVRGVRERAPRS